MQDTLNFTERIGLDDREPLRAKSVVPAFDAGAPVVRDGFHFAGTHLLLDVRDAQSLDDVEAMELAFRSAVDAAGATLLIFISIVSRVAEGCPVWPCWRRAISRFIPGPSIHSRPPTYSCVAVPIPIRRRKC